MRARQQARGVEVGSGEFASFMISGISCSPAPPRHSPVLHAAMTRWKQAIVSGLENAGNQLLEDDRLISARSAVFGRRYPRRARSAFPG